MLQVLSTTLPFAHPLSTPRIQAKTSQINCNKFYRNLTFCKLNTYLILASACFGLLEQNGSTDKSFFKDFTCLEVTPLSANICACTEIVVESEYLETLHYIFGPQQNKFFSGEVVWVYPCEDKVSI